MTKKERLDKMYANPIHRRIVEICEEAGYGVDRAYLDEIGSPRIGIYPKDTSFHSYYPSVYPDVEYNLKDHKSYFLGWRIQTIAYGSLPLEEYKKMMDIQIGTMRMVEKLDRLSLSKLERLPTKFDDDAD